MSNTAPTPDFDLLWSEFRQGREEQQHQLARSIDLTAARLKELLKQYHSTYQPCLGDLNYGTQAELMLWMERVIQDC